MLLHLGFVQHQIHGRLEHGRRGEGQVHELVRQAVELLEGELVQQTSRVAHHFGIFALDHPRRPPRLFVLLRGRFRAHRAAVTAAATAAAAAAAS